MRVYKSVLFYLILLLASLEGFSQNASSGVYFEKTSLEQVKKKAAQVKKPIFIELYSPSCHVCESFKPTFNKAEVGKFYNSQFLNYKLDIDSKEAQVFLQKQNLFIPSLPLLLFYDPSFNLSHVQIVNNEASELINAAKKSQTFGSRSTDFKKIYELGERNQNFLIEYGFFSRIIRDTTANIKAVESYILALKPSEFESQTNLLVIQKVMMDVFNPLFDYFIMNKESYEKKYSKQSIEDTAENILMTTLYSSRSKKFSKSQFDLLEDYLLRIKSKKEVMNRIVIPEIQAYSEQKKLLELSSILNRYFDADASSESDKLFLLNYTFELTLKNKAFLHPLLSLSNHQSLSLVSPKELPELLLLRAKLYMALDHKTKAQELASKALSLAKEGNLSIDKFEDFCKSVH